MLHKLHPCVRCQIQVVRICHGYLRGHHVLHSERDEGADSRQIAQEKRHKRRRCGMDFSERRQRLKLEFFVPSNSKANVISGDNIFDSQRVGGLGNGEGLLPVGPYLVPSPIGFYPVCLVCGRHEYPERGQRLEPEVLFHTRQM